MTSKSPAARTPLAPATSVTLSALVAMAGLHLTVLAGHDRLARPVRWVHTSELDDPAPYLEGGELLLTTGLKLGRSREKLRRYVHRLADAGVAGLGFGIGLTYGEVPAALVEAAEERGLPLLQVPQPTPFIAISKAVTAALAAEQYQAVTTSFEAQEELTRAALGKDGTAALIGRLAARLGGWAALYDASGAVVAAAPDWAVRRAGRLRPEVERLRSRPAPTSASLQGGRWSDGPVGAAVTEKQLERQPEQQDPPEPVSAAGQPGRPEQPDDQAAGDFVVLQSLGADRRARGFLAVGTEDRLTPGERYVLNAAVALLTLTLERSRDLRRAEERMRTALLRLVLAGETGTAREVAGALLGGLPEGQVRVLVAEGAGMAALGDLAEQSAIRAGEPLLLAPEGERLVLLALDGGAVHIDCVAAVEDLDAVTLGISGPTVPEAAGAAYTQAERALAVAQRSGRHSVDHDEVGSGSLFPLLANEAVLAFSDGLLRPLREHDRSARGDLEASLYAWLSRHGQWDAAAADLGVHRHTLRYRMRRVEELLGRSLDDADVRMELWLALRARNAG
ncbi:PucR family transcriptional regulator [Streptacidiphilus sp. PB12-B1b]|uniref:PucR family transcriptional regulator n=1 Tax=Streptacidiphilus sp. PB12-B1b TaxID=2705012 RepID=UPI0015FE1DA9|nr:PucR family transcriptional regulator [Streptacidiphilus sp. PB12-B1b]QMU78831.1 PucR family transcriptional regulator [Streptacidiphilus sp. PB12-B1b]